MTDLGKVTDFFFLVVRKNVPRTRRICEAARRLLLSLRMGVLEGSLVESDPIAPQPRLSRVGPLTG